MTFVSDPEFNKKAVYSSDTWDEIFTEKGKVVEAAAVALAAPHTETGSFEEHMSGEMHRAGNGHPFYRVSNDDDAALSIEFGTVHMHGLHVLGRAIDAAGGA